MGSDIRGQAIGILLVAECRLLSSGKRLLRVTRVVCIAESDIGLRYDTGLYRPSRCMDLSQKLIEDISPIAAIPSPVVAISP